MKLREFLAMVDQIRAANEAPGISFTEAPPIKTEFCMLVNAYDEQGRPVASVGVDLPALDSIVRELEMVIRLRLLAFTKPSPSTPEGTE